jgi:DNA-binding beta-propeller fold protein YncE
VTVGRGPYDVVAAPTRRLLFVSNYLEDSIAVIDLTPGAPTENQVVLRLGESKK